jgi:hypothetical protein
VCLCEYQIRELHSSIDEVVADQQYLEQELKSIEAQQDQLQNVSVSLFYFILFYFFQTLIIFVIIVASPASECVGGTS